MLWGLKIKSPLCYPKSSDLIKRALNVNQKRLAFNQKSKRVYIKRTMCICGLMCVLRPQNQEPSYIIPGVLRPQNQEPSILFKEP